MKLIRWLFSFGAKYRKREEKYFKDSRRIGNGGHLIMLILYALAPLVSLWALFNLNWDADYWPLKFFCFAGVIFIVHAPTELMVTGIIALRHRAAMKMANKVHNTIETQVTGKESSREIRGTSPKTDLAIGITGIILSIAVVVAFVIMLMYYLTHPYLYI